MSERNGDKARFQKNRKRRLLQRQRTRAWIAKASMTTVDGAAGTANGNDAGTFSATRVASRAMQDEGGPTRSGD